MPPILQLPLYRSLNIKTENNVTKKPSIRTIALSHRFRIFCASILCFILIYHIFTSRTVYTSPETAIPAQIPAVIPGETDWSRFAYVQYVTNPAYLCNSLMIFESLHRLGSKADRLMLMPAKFTDETKHKAQSKLVKKAQTEFGVKVKLIEVQQHGEDPTWGNSFTKLLAFNQTEYPRVISLDSDSTVLQAIDELFLLPSTPIAMPKAYWLTNHEFSSQLILLEPSTTEFTRIQAAIATAKETEFDMEILNKLYGKTATVLPHQVYDMITGELGSTDHTKFLGSRSAVWDIEKVLKELKFVHFSDWPLPKPWFSATSHDIAKTQPKCVAGKDAETGRATSDCRARDTWLEFYADFRERRMEVCGIDYRRISLSN